MFFHDFLFSLLVIGVSSFKELTEGYFPLHCSLKAEYGLHVCVCDSLSRRVAELAKNGQYYSAPSPKQKH